MTTHEDKYEHLTDKDIIKGVVFTQLFLLFISFGLLYFFYDDYGFIQEIFQVKMSEILTVGVTSGIVIVYLQCLLSEYLPEKWFEDDGLNERIFKNMTVIQVFLVALFVSFIEEWLFRGVIQTKLGLVVTSLIFAMIHVRYLKKILLMSLLIGISFWFGWIYKVTDCLWVTIVAHFLVDFLLGLYIIKKSKENGVEEGG